MKLKDWLEQEDMSVPQFAKSINTSKQAVYSWLDGTVLPNAESLAFIQVATHAAVLPLDFLPPRQEPWQIGNG